MKCYVVNSDNISLRIPESEVVSAILSKGGTVTTESVHEVLMQKLSAHKYKMEKLSQMFDAISTADVDDSIAKGSNQLFNPKSPKINVYSGEKGEFKKYAALSNFLSKPVIVSMKGITREYLTIEHAYQSAKALFAGDVAAASQIADMPTGFDAQKAAGKKAGLINWTVKQPEDWDAIQSNGKSNAYNTLAVIMHKAYEQNPSMRNLLMSTGDSEITHIASSGANMGVWGKDFPEILMSIRRDLRRSEASSSAINFQEDQSTGYKERTVKNASADATIAIAVDFSTAGEILTKSSVLNQNKKYIPVNISSADSIIIDESVVEKIVNELNSVGAKTLNIAGNGIYTMKGKYTQTQLDGYVEALLTEVFNHPNLKNKIESIRSGGQTGIDEAGAKASIKLGLPTTVLAPKGWKFRDETGDKSNEDLFKQRFGIKPITEEKLQASKTVEKPVDGVQVVRNSMDKSEIQFILDYVKPIIENEGFFANAATSKSKHANLMFSMGWSAWVPKRIIAGREDIVKPVYHIDAQAYYNNKSKIDALIRQGKSEEEIAKDLYENNVTTYVYSLRNPDGSSITPIPDEIFATLDRNFGIKSKGVYDSIIGNIYENDMANGGFSTMIQFHEDTTEPYKNLAPIRVLVLGNNYSIKLDNNLANANLPRWSGVDRNGITLNVQQGDVYEIGSINEAGKSQSRYIGHMPFVNENTGVKNNLKVALPTLVIPDKTQISFNGDKRTVKGRSISNYAMSLTFRSVEHKELSPDQLVAIVTKDLGKSESNASIKLQDNNNVSKTYTEGAAEADNRKPIAQNFFDGYRPNSDTSKIHSIRQEITDKYGKGVKTFDLVKAGVRTRTTRLANWMKENNPKEGDFFWQINEKNPDDKVLTRITSVYNNKDPRFKFNWYKEGWIDSDFDYVKGYDSAVEFEVVEPSSNPEAKHNRTRRYTPANITSLAPNEVYVFGANRAGGHGGGAAGIAQFGTATPNYKALPYGTKGKWSEYGVVNKLMEGTEGKSFGVVTKDATIQGNKLVIGKPRSVELEDIKESITELMQNALENQDLTYLVTDFGTNMAGFTVEEMRNLLKEFMLPDNIILSRNFEYRDSQEHIEKIRQYNREKFPSLYEDIGDEFSNYEEEISEENADILKLPEQKLIIIAPGSKSTNTPIFENEDAIYLMNDMQQEAYDFLKKQILEKMIAPKTISEDKVTFSDILGKEYSDIIPVSLWENMFGLMGDAGTGKTTMLNRLIKDITLELAQNKYMSGSIIYTGPTHQATTVMQESLGGTGEYVNEDNVVTYAALVGRNVPKDNTLELSEKKSYIDGIKAGRIAPLSSRALIVFDESSMFSAQMMKDIMTRFEQEAEAGYFRQLPVMLFTGDYKQLPDIEENPKGRPVHKKASPESEGIISSTVFNTEAKFKRLTQVMRAKNDDILNVTKSIGEEIERRRVEHKAGKKPAPVDTKKYDELTKQSSENILVATNMDGVIDDYTDFMMNNSNPYGMFWLHYNRLGHENTQSILKKIRKNYFEKLVEKGIHDDIDIIDETYDSNLVDNNPSHPFYNKNTESKSESIFYAHDYIQFVENVPLYGEPAGQFKPKSRYKVLKTENIRMSMSDFVFKSKPNLGRIARYLDPTLKVDVLKATLLNKGGKERTVYLMENMTVRTRYNKATGQMEIYLVNVFTGKIAQKFDVSYSLFRSSIAAELPKLKNAYELFNISYIGSSHTAQGAQFNTVIFGEENIRKNRSAVEEKTIMSSAYTSLTRAIHKLIILKQQNAGIKNNQSVFVPYNDNEISKAEEKIKQARKDKNESANTPSEKDKSAEEAKLKLDDMTCGMD